MMLHFFSEKLQKSTEPFRLEMVSSLNYPPRTNKGSNKREQQDEDKLSPKIRLKEPKRNDPQSSSVNAVILKKSEHLTLPKTFTVPTAKQRGVPRSLVAHSNETSVDLTAVKPTSSRDLWNMNHSATAYMIDAKAEMDQKAQQPTRTCQFDHRKLNFSSYDYIYRKELWREITWREIIKVCVFVCLFFLIS